MPITQRDHMIIAEDFTRIEVNVAQVKQALENAGFKTSEKNVDYLLERNFLKDVEQTFIQQLPEKMEHLLLERVNGGQYPGLEELE